MHHCMSEWYDFCLNSLGRLLSLVPFGSGSMLMLCEVVLYETLMDAKGRRGGEYVYFLRFAIKVWSWLNINSIVSYSILLKLQRNHYYLSDVLLTYYHHLMLVDCWLIFLLFLFFYFFFPLEYLCSASTWYSSNFFEYQISCADLDFGDVPGVTHLGFNML